MSLKHNKYTINELKEAHKGTSSHKSEIIANQITELVRYQSLTSQQTYNLLKSDWDLGRLEFIEEFKVILLNRRNRTLGVIDISIGGFAGAVVDSKVIFGAALTACASGNILVHNHPSGETEPSQLDINLTKRLVQARKILDVPIVEHLIISKDVTIALVMRDC